MVVYLSLGETVTRTDSFAQLISLSLPHARASHLLSLKNLNKGRGDMTKAKNSKTLPKNILDSAIREAVVSAIKKEHLDVSAAIKSVSSVTQINADAIAKWHTGQHTPSTAHFLTLSMFYPSVLQVLLTLIGREDLWDLAVRENIPKRMHESLSNTHFKYKKRGDIFTAKRAQKSAFSFNERQLWFLDMIYKTSKMQNKHIVLHWNVTLRTAKRDTQGLMDAGIIRSVRAGGTGWFEPKGATNVPA